MRQFEVLNSYEEIKELVDLVADNYKVTYKLTIKPGIVEIGDGAFFNFEINTTQETEDEYIFNEDDSMYVEMESDLGGIGINLGYHVTFYYYELDKGDINDTQSYDNIKTKTRVFDLAEGFGFTFDKQTYLLKEFEVVIKKRE